MYPLIAQLTKAQQATHATNALSAEEKNALLGELKHRIQDKAHIILTENMHDVTKAQENKLPYAFIKRLKLDEKNIDNMIRQLNVIQHLPDPIGTIMEEKQLANGIRLQKVRVPIGVIGIIYESRPNVTLDATTLTLKSGNVVVLKGGSEAYHSNKAIISIIHEALEAVHIPQEAVTFLDTTERSIVQELIKQPNYIDLIIPRGGHGLVSYVIEHASVPVLSHANGGARIYIDASAPINMAVDICINAKVRNPAVCNALDTIIVHENIADIFLPQVYEQLKAHNVTIRSDEKAHRIIPETDQACDTDYETEFLDYIVSIKTVRNPEEAITFIQNHTHHHSEGIVAENETIIHQFTQSIDAAAVFVNCSTGFHDGGMFEMGAEMGIATGKIHARGPVGLEELTTYKRIAYGTGQTRT